jgi:hypothetical protein
MTTFLFLRVTHDLPGLAGFPTSRIAVTRGEPRIRPFVPIPLPVPPTCVSLPDRDTEPTATPQATASYPAPT